MVALHRFPNRPSAADCPCFTRVRALLSAGLFAFAGCVDEPNPTDPAAIDSADVSPTASEQPVDAAAARLTGFRLREQVGRLDLSETGGPEEVVRPPYDLTGRVSPNAEKLRRASLRAQRRASELGLVASAMLADADGILYADFVDPASAYSDSRGIGIAPASDRPSADEDFAEKGLSHGQDNRLFLGTGSWAPDSHSAFRRIGDLSSGYCTGTLFGRRLVFTAAHCVVNSGGWWSSKTFAPRRRGSTYPYGSSTQWGTTWPAAYTANNCHTNYTSACVKYDFAVMILPNSPTFKYHPGWMGFVYSSDATTASWYRLNVGYPYCGSSMSPANCKPKEPYGDLFGCSGVTPKFSQGSTANRWPYGNGANPVISTGCDISGGHSGGPVYTHSAGSNGPYIIGNQVWHLCTGSGCNGSSYSGAGVRINSTLGNWMLWLRQSVYP